MSAGYSSYYAFVGIEKPAVAFGVAKRPVGHSEWPCNQRQGVAAREAVVCIGSLEDVYISDVVQVLVASFFFRRLRWFEIQRSDDYRSHQSL